MIFIPDPKLRKEDLPDIEKAVAIAFLSALVTGLVGWGFEIVKEARKKAEQKT